MPGNPSSISTVEDLRQLQAKLLELRGEVTMIIKRAELAEVREFEAKHVWEFPEGSKR